ncbi:prepilin peptidase [Arthrobacter sp. NPDC090010]|uniref:prepilin peptidase n=1 Tax=Arthrobacter sp. NPDC090010 TaxID=3363942 RepID=UPI003816C33C
MLTRIAQFWGLGQGWALAAAILLLLAAVVFVLAGARLAWIDARTKLLPNRIVFPWAWAAGALLLAACLCAGLAVREVHWFAYAPLSGQAISPGGFIVTGTPGSAEFERSLDEQLGELAAPIAGIWGLRVLAGGALSWLGYFLLRVVYPRGMGFGDVKLAGVLGLYLGYLGWWPMLLGPLVAFILGGVFSAVLLVTRKATRTSHIPFGPFMITGAALVMLLPV